MLTSRFFTLFSLIKCHVSALLENWITSKGFDFIQSTYRGELAGIYQHNYFDHDKRDFFFNNTLFELKNKRLIEVGNNYCQVLYTKDQHGWGQTMIKELSVFHVTGDVNKVIGFARSNNMN